MLRAYLQSDRKPNHFGRLLQQVFEVMSSLPHECMGYLTSLYLVAQKYMALPAEIVTDTSKIAILLKVKETEHTSSLYLPLLFFISNQALIGDLSRFTSDIDYFEEQKNKVSEGYDQYCNGNYNNAEALFSEVMSCKVPYIAELAITNLAYMVRRKETDKKYSFEELMQRITYLSEFDLMNTILYYVSNDETDNRKYLSARAKLDKLTEDERNSIYKWWSNTSLVGEEESKLALSLINPI